MRVNQYTNLQTQKTTLNTQSNTRMRPNCKKTQIYIQVTLVRKIQAERSCASRSGLLWCATHKIPRNTTQIKQQGRTTEIPRNTQHHATHNTTQIKQQGRTTEIPRNTQHHATPHNTQRHTTHNTKQHHSNQTTGTNNGNTTGTNNGKTLTSAKKSIPISPKHPRGAGLARCAGLGRSVPFC